MISFPMEHNKEQRVYVILFPLKETTLKIVKTTLKDSQKDNV